MADRSDSKSLYGKARPEDSGPPPSLGTRLSKAREARRIPIEGIAQQLRVPVKVVRAIEEDRLEGIAPIYLRGYVRAYARIVGLSEDSVLVGLPSTETPVVATSRSGRVMDRGVRSGGGLKLATVVVVAILIGLMVASFRTPIVDDVAVDEVGIDARLAEGDTGLEAGRAEPETSAIGATPALPDTAPATPEPMPPVPPSAVPPAAPGPAVAPSDDNPVAGSAAVAEAAPSAPPVTPGAEAPEGAGALTADHKLVLELDRESWTEVQDARGAKLYYALAAAGQTIKVAGEPPFRVVLGNAPDVEVFYNGKPFDVTPWSRGRVARFTVGDAPPADGHH